MPEGCKERMRLHQKKYISVKIEIRAGINRDVYVQLHPSMNGYSHCVSVCAVSADKLLATWCPSVKEFLSCHCHHPLLLAPPFVLLSQPASSSPLSFESSNNSVSEVNSLKISGERQKCVSGAAGRQTGLIDGRQRGLPGTWLPTLQRKNALDGRSCSLHRRAYTHALNGCTAKYAHSHRHTHICRCLPIAPAAVMSIRWINYG